MESKADPDTQIEVNILILDYLLCTTLNTILFARREEDREESQGRDSSWLGNSVNTIKSLLPSSETLPRDLRIKLQLWDFTNLCCRYLWSTPNRPLATEPLWGGNGIQDRAEESTTTQSQLPTPRTEITSAFLTLCAAAENKISEMKWADISVQFMLQATLEKYQIAGDCSPDILNEYIARAPESLKHTLRQTSTKYMSYLHPPIEASFHAHLEAMSEKSYLNQFGSTVVEFLIDLMKQLDPPVLVQLERGKINGLSRAETQELKKRVGLW